MFSAASKLFAALLLLSLAGKAAVIRVPSDPDPRPALAAADRTLKAAGFSSRVIVLPRSPGMVTAGSLGNCRIMIGDYPPQGLLRSVYRAMATPVGSLSFAYRGSLLQTEPQLTGLADLYVWRFLGRVGIRVMRAPVLAVIASPACDLDRVDWKSLAKVENV